MTISLKLFLSFLIFPIGFAASSANKASVSGSPITVVHMEEEILHFVNIDRKSKGLKPLQLNDTESSIALQHSMNMASGKTPFGHEGLEERARTIRKKIGHISTAGENVASGQMTAREVVDGWLNSPGHRKNIEGDFLLTGIGCVKDKRGMIYFTQIFTR